VCGVAPATPAKPATTSNPALTWATGTLVAAYGYDEKLAMLPGRMSCPRCHSSVVGIEWIVPDPKPAPFAPAADVLPLRMKATRGEAARRKLRIVGGEGG
jgi:hypothetical protein